MSRIKRQLPSSQVQIFHKNIQYMLSKLNTTFYHLKYDNDGKNHILPAYSI